jgi:hypothetical protein
VNEASELVTVPLGPPLIVVSGALRSIRTVTERCVLRPAPFVAAHATIAPAVSAVSVVAAQPVELATSETGSETAQLTVTSPLYQPLAPNLPVIDGVTSGGLESYLSVVVADVDSPAPLVQEPLTTADFVSGPLYPTGAVHPEIPETASTPEKATLRGWVYQPLCAGFDVGSAATDGPVVSTLTTTLTCAPNPSVFVAEQLSVWPVVSPPTVVVAQPDEEAMPDSGSATAHITVTAPVYQPFAPSVPDNWGAIDGGVVSAAASCVTGRAAVAKISGRSATNASAAIQRTEGFNRSPLSRADRRTTRCTPAQNRDSTSDEKTRLHTRSRRSSGHSHAARLRNAALFTGSARRDFGRAHLGGLLMAGPSADINHGYARAPPQPRQLAIGPGFAAVARRSAAAGAVSEAPLSHSTI